MIGIILQQQLHSQSAAPPLTEVNPLLTLLTLAIAVCSLGSVAIGIHLVRARIDGKDLDWRLVSLSWMLIAASWILMWVTP